MKRVQIAWVLVKWGKKGRDAKVGYMKQDDGHE
jgi:hypothetical protein